MPGNIQKTDDYVALVVPAAVPEASLLPGGLKLLLGGVVLTPIAALAFLIWSVTKSAGSLVLTLLHMSNCDANGNPVRGDGTGINAPSITCDQLRALPGNTTWPAFGSVFGCDLGGTEGPWSVSDLIKNFCDVFQHNCLNVWNDAFTDGTKDLPASRHQSLLGNLFASVGKYCEANTSSWVGLALILSVAIVSMAAIFMVACIAGILHPAPQNPVQNTASPLVVGTANLFVANNAEAVVHAAEQPNDQTGYNRSV